MAGLRARTVVKSPRAVEVSLMREALLRDFRGLLGPLVMFAVQLFMPGRRHFFLPALINTAIVLSCGAYILWVLATADGHFQTKRMHILSDAVQHTTRTLGHLSVVIWANEDLLGRLIFLYVAPCGASRLTYPGPYKAYVVAHAVLVLYRFTGGVADDWMFMISAFACCHLLYEGFVTRRRIEEGAQEKTRAMVTLAEEISCSVFDCFCDATVRVSADLDILDDSPSLSTLLSRRASGGRSFRDFVHMSDRRGYSDFIKNISNEVGESDSTRTSTDNVGRLQLRSVGVHLEDSFNVPVEVHLFHACMETVDEKPFYLIGIIERESYRYSKKKTGRSERLRKEQKRRVDSTTLNFESGMLEPARPAFEQKDVALMSSIELLRDGTAADGSSSSRRRAGGSGQERPGSPRPEVHSGRPRFQSS